MQELIAETASKLNIEAWHRQLQYLAEYFIQEGAYQGQFQALQKVIFYLSCTSLSPSHHTCSPLDITTFLDH